MNERDPVTGMTEKELTELAEDAYARRDDADAWQEELVEISPEVRSVVSVRFNKGELGAIERAAAEAGLPVPTYIHNAALVAADAVDVEAARRAIQNLLRDAQQVHRLLEPHPKPAA